MTAVRSFASQVRRLEQVPVKRLDSSMLETFSEVAKTFVDHARPALREDILPALQRDKELQRTVGLAVGEGMGTKLVPWVVGGFAAIVLTLVLTRSKST